MKNNKKGMSMELAIGFMVLVSVIIALSFTVFMLSAKQNKNVQDMNEDSVYLEQIGEDFRQAVIDNDYFPKNGGNYTNVDITAKSFRYNGELFKYTTEDKTAQNQKELKLYSEKNNLLLTICLEKNGSSWRIISWKR